MLGLIWTSEIDERFLWRLLQNAESRQLLLHSHGGDCGCMSAALDLMAERDWTVGATGAIYSAAVPIVAVGAPGYRAATPNTRFLVHLPRLFTLGDYDSEGLTQESDELKKMEKIYTEALGNTTKKSAKWWMARIKAKTDFYFDAEEAIRLGVIDSIE